MTGRATNAMLLQGAAPRERGQSTGAFAVRLVAGPRRSTAVHGTALCGALIALALEGSIFFGQHRRGRAESLVWCARLGPSSDTYTLF